MSRRNTLTPEMERELEALDAALAGEDTDAELAEIVAFVREERPAVDPSFARELDEWAGEGFPRRDAPASRRLRLPAFLRTRPLLPALGVAATVLVGLIVVTSVLRNGETTDHGLSQSQPSLATPAPADTTEPPVTENGSSGAAGAPSVPGRTTRKQELTALLSLGVPAKRIDEVSSGVLKATNRYGGVVMRSDVSSTTGATFDLRIPAGKLQAALAALSELGNVEARNQTSTDITAAFVSPRERLTDGLAERKGLLKQLAKATTPNETASIRARLRIASRQIATARGELRGLRERTNFAKVSVEVHPRGSSGGGGGWGIGDGLDDGLRILAWVCGALIVALAVALPFLVLGGFGAGAARALRRRRREHALDGI